MKKQEKTYYFRISLFSILCLITLSSFAQKKMITGMVKDQSGEVLIGVNVSEKGTKNGTITDMNGQYSIEVENGQSVLLFSYIGYLSQQISVSDRNEIIITMEEDTEELEEVVVIGYGTAKKKDLTGAISSIKTEQLAAESPNSIQDLMRANSPGLNIGLSTGAMDESSLQVRGKNTLKAGSAPLLVLDGVIYEGELSDINPSDIEAIDVLKDASSAAVYGAKAANGVVVITTKKGKAGKPVINFNTNIGFVQVANQREILDADGFVKYRQDYEMTRNSTEYLNKYPEIFTDPRKLQNVDQLTWYNYTQNTPVESVTEEQLLRAWLARLDFKAPEIDNYLAGNITNWDDLVFQTGLQQNYTASISNRTDDMSYYWSLGYNDNEGIVTGDRFTNFRTRLNLESKITKFLTVGLNSSFSSRNQGFQACDWGQMVRISPFGSNNIDDLDSPYRRLPTGDRTPVNPFYDNLYRDKKKMYHNLNANIYAKVSLPFGIEYQLNFIPYYQWYEDFLHESSESEEWANKGGHSVRTTQKIFNWQLDNIFRWRKEFANKHTLEATFLINAEKGQRWKQTAEASNYSPSDVLGYHRLQAGTVPLVSSEDTYKTGDALMGRLFYSYKNKYMITGSVRRDGYSAFGQMHPRAVFPAVAAGWTFSSEKFMEKASSWLNYGKLRLSWGQNGNRDIGQYEALSDLTSGLHPYIDENGNVYTSSQLYVNRMANAALRWERTSSFNVGLDYSVFNDIISGSFEFYKSKTNDLLVDRVLPTVTGFNSVAANLGEIQNKGFELSINANIIRKEDFSWRASGNFSLNRRKITHLYGEMVDVVDENGNVIGQREADDIKNKWFIGHDSEQIWDYVRDGVWQENEAEEAAKYGCQPGDFKYLDLNKDGVMTDDDKVFQKNKTPRFYWTLRNEFTFWKNLSLSFMLYSQWGHYGTFNNAANAANFPDRCSDYVQPYWTPDNPINDFARIGSKNIGNYYLNKSFIRLDNITVSYNVPKNFLKKYSIQGMRLSMSIRNVAVFSPDWKYWDPETGKPTPRTFNLGINFTL
ncbi:MAG: SusC/RagA family TonB-linked outer membrane protein [Parabacteroides sp.]|nr:SusC/RagA family TonB-linked outer membrane protein [Parabacteroides sp.]